MKTFAAWIFGALSGWLMAKAFGAAAPVQAMAAFAGATFAWLLHALIELADEPPPPPESPAPPGYRRYDLPDELVYRVFTAVPDATVIEAIEVLLHRDDLSHIPTTEREA